MNYIEDLILCSILLYFPIMCYLLYLSLNKDTNIKRNDIIFNFMLLISTLLLVSRDITGYRRVQVLLSNVPLFIAFTYKKSKTAFIIALMIMFYSQIHNSNYLLFIQEYLIYFVIYFIYYIFYKNRRLVFYLLVFYFNKLFLFFVRRNQIDSFYSTALHKDNFLITLPLCVLISYFLIKLLSKGEDLIDKNKRLSEYENNETIRTSLCKITHEIKNPLTVCKGYLGMLNIENSNQCKRYIPIVKKEVDHILDIIKDFSDLSKIKIEKTFFDLHELLKDVINSTNEIFKKEKIKVIYNNSNEYIIEADYQRLKQVILNIFKNSKEALDNIKNKKIIIEVYEDNKYICFSIENNGPTVDKEFFDKVGEAFYTTKTYGTGLGILFSKEIIQKHNGIIEFVSEKGFKTIIKIPKS